MAVVSRSLSFEFSSHKAGLRALQKRKVEEIQLTSLVHDAREHRTAAYTYGQRQPGDVYKGDVALRDLRNILHAFDRNGYERSENQQMFHDSFIRSTARVLYSDDWRTSQPAIMTRNGWGTCSSEIMVKTPSCGKLAPACPILRLALRRVRFQISTPRRFGKTFRCALPCALRCHHVWPGYACCRFPCAQRFNVCGRLLDRLQQRNSCFQ